MTRNQKIALGCGGAGCLGLIVAAIAGTVIYLFVLAPAKSRAYNFNVNVNTNSNSNVNTNDNTNDNSEVPSNINANSNSSNTSTSSISDDDKHKLYQAASMTGDTELLRRVSVKIGLMDEDYTPGDNYQTFIAEHVGWALRNSAFIQSINTPEKARAYVNDHFPE